MVPLVRERRLLLVLELGDRREAFRITRDKSSAAEEIDMLGHAMRHGKRPTIDDSLFIGNALYE